MDLKLEAIIIPVSDVDRAKKFYAEALEFRIDVDRSSGDNYRIVQLTSPASECSFQTWMGYKYADRCAGTRGPQPFQY